MNYEGIIKYLEDNDVNINKLIIAYELSSAGILTERRVEKLYSIWLESDINSSQVVAEAFINSGTTISYFETHYKDYIDWENV